MRWMRIALCALTTLAVAGCPTGDEDPPPDDPLPDDPPPALPVAHCGMDAYEVLSFADVGEALYWERIDTFDLTAAGLDALLTLAGFEALTPVPNGVVLFRYRYTTQDRGEPTEATGMIAVPGHLESAPAEPWPVALLLHGYAGAWDACAPSADDLIGPAQPALLASQGFVVVAPDFIGMNGTGAPSTAPHAPLVGEQMAIGSWDAMRAGMELLRGDLADEFEGEMRDDLVIWGASQGGHAAFFVEAAGPYYGPEFDVVGVVASSPAHDQLAVVSAAMEQYSDATGLAALALVGMWRWYGVPDDLDGLLTNEEPYHFADAVVELLAGVPDECEFDLDFEIEVDEVSDIYDQSFIDAVLAGDWDTIEPWSCFVHENSVSTSSIERKRSTPVMTVYGELDTLVVPSLQEADFAALCDSGWQLQQLQCQGAPHGETTLWSLDEQVTWLRARLAGEPLDAPCTWNGPVCCSASPEDVCPSRPPDDEVNGTVRDMGDHRVVHLWGSPEEMGYAHGYLLGDSILALATGYALDLFGLTPSEYEMFRGLILVMLDFPAEHVAEAEALIEGMRDAGVELYREELGREIDADDVLLINAAADMFGVELGCSSISAWGAATEDDAELDGELAMARDLDWRWLGSEADLRDHSVVFAFDPSTPGTQRWVSMAFPGFIGCLSCLNEEGVGAFQDQGNHSRSIVELDLSDDLVPIHLSLRAGIETRDYDGDGSDTIHDAVAAVTANGRLGTYDIQLISPADRTDPPAAVLEADNGGWALRLPTDDPLPAPDCLAVTNHDRLLHPPEPCSRYATIEAMVDDLDGQLDLERLWTIEAAVAQSWGSGGTIQTLRVVPADLRVDVAFADHGDVAPDNPITSHEWSWLFEDEDPGDDDTASDDDDDDDAADDDAGDDDDGTGGEASLGPGSCGCGTGGGAGPLAGMGLLLLCRLTRSGRRS